MVACFEPRSMRELSACLDEMTPKSKIISGGTDLVMQMHSRRVAPDILLDPCAIPELNDIALQNGVLSIGAACTMRRLSVDPLLTGAFRIISDAAKDIGSPQIRSKATIAGNMANASPASDMLPNLFALDATAVVAGPGGRERTVSMPDLVTGPGKTSLAYNEIITRFDIPTAPFIGWQGAFVKLGFRSRVTVARIGVTVLAKGGADGVMGDVQLWIGAVSLQPVHLTEAEQLMRGRKPDAALAQQVGEILSEKIYSITPEKFDRDYKVNASRGIVEDAFGLLAGRL